MLYSLKLTIEKEEAVIDSETVPFGIRTFEFTANDGFHLNGQRVQICGVNLRYLLGSIDGFNPSQHAVEYKDMLPIDRWAMEQLEVLITEVHRSYDEYAFHRVFSLIYNFCTVQMSSIYMDVLKDRMYCDAKTSLSRRSGQTAMYHTLEAIIRLMAPILAHSRRSLGRSH
jgi:isoleucyl-tRNA synthetase